MMLLQFSSCLICRENQHLIRWRSGIAKREVLTRFVIVTAAEIGARLTVKFRWYSIFPDGHTFFNRYKIRPVRHFSTRRTRRNHQTSSFDALHSFNNILLCSTIQAKRFARAMHASLIFCSTSASINVQKIFKIVLAKAFDLKCVIPEIEGVGEPILIYVDV